jgi:hypothetical protein
MNTQTIEPTQTLLTAPVEAPMVPESAEVIKKGKLWTCRRYFYDNDYSHVDAEGHLPSQLTSIGLSRLGSTDLMFAMDEPNTGGEAMKPCVRQICRIGSFSENGSNFNFYIYEKVLPISFNFAKMVFREEISATTDADIVALTTNMIENFGREKFFVWIGKIRELGLDEEEIERIIKLVENPSPKAWLIQ